MPKVYEVITGLLCVFFHIIYFKIDIYSLKVYQNCKLTIIYVCGRFRFCEWAYVYVYIS